MRSEDRPCKKLKHWALVLYISNSTMEYGVKDWMEHPCIMTSNQSIWKLWDSAPIGKVALQDCHNHDQRHYGENWPMAIFNSFEANYCCKLLNLSYQWMVLLLGGKYLHQCRKSSNVTLSDRWPYWTSEQGKLCLLLPDCCRHKMWDLWMFKDV